MAQPVNQAARNYLHKHNVLCLATTQGRQPWVSPVFYALWRGRFIFLSAPHTRHALNLEQNPQVSASVQQDYSDWQEIKGIQIEGVVSSVDTADVDNVISCYADKFPVTGSKAPPQIAKALDKIRWYQLEPTHMYFIDNSQGLGHREQFTLD